MTSTLSVAVPIYNYLIDQLEDRQDSEDTEVEKLSNEENAAVSAALNKLKYYYCRADSEVYAICTSIYLLFFEFFS